MTAYGAIDSAVESIRRGAYHYLTKPFKLDELALFLERALDDARAARETAALRARCVAAPRSASANRPRCSAWRRSSSASPPPMSPC